MAGHQRHPPVIARALGSRSTVCFPQLPDVVPPVRDGGPADMKRWAKVSTITRRIFDEHEREEEFLCVSRYWEVVEEGWFSD